ncbi:MAG: sulfite exporter TauE/SafE family protein [Nitrospirota bacterium]
MPSSYLFLFCTGSLVGFFSGLLGIGGGILMFPLLLYMPPLLGIEPIGVKDITGLTMVQGFFASLSALALYRRQRLVSRSLVTTFGLPLFLSSFIGALVSGHISDNVLLFLFGIMALVAAVMMLIPRSYAHDDLTEDKVRFNKAIAVLTSVFVGTSLGMVGQGGAFLVIPILLYVLRIPLRVALGSTLGIGLFSSTAGLAGKIATGQVPFLLAAALLIGAIPFARLGSIVSQRSGTTVLRWLLAFIISATAVKVWIDIF